MKLAEIQARHESLPDSLAAVIGYLRAGVYRDVPEEWNRLVSGAAGEFVRELAAHLREEEEVLFSALEQEMPSSRPVLAALREDHRRFRNLSGRLALRLREGTRTAPYRISLQFLAALMEHLDRESEALENLLENLPAEVEERLTEALFDRRVRSALREFQPHLAEWNARADLLQAGRGTVRLRLRWNEGIASGLHSLRSRLTRLLKARIPAVTRIEYEYANPEIRP